VTSGPVASERRSDEVRGLFVRSARFVSLVPRSLNDRWVGLFVWSVAGSFLA